VATAEPHENSEAVKVGVHELRRGLYVGFVMNLAVAAILNNNTWSAPSAQVWLVTLGTTNELYGVLLIASPELIPRLRLALSWSLIKLSRLATWFWRHLRRLLRIRKHHTMRVAGEVNLASSISPRVSGKRLPPAGATQDELIAFLGEQVAQLQDRVDDLRNRVADLPEEWRRDIAETRTELEGLSRRLVRAVADARIRLRLLGLGFVVLGLVLSWLGNIL